MPVIDIKDMRGNILPAREVNTVRLPTVYPEDCLDDIQKFKLREDDILISNWMRSGSHWLLEMVHMLLNDNTDTVPQEKRDQMLEYQPMSVFDKLPSRRVLCTHLHFRHLPEDLKTKPCHVIYPIRNPRDAMVSWFKLHQARPHYAYKGVFQDWLIMCLNGELHWGSWFDHVREWEKTFEDQPNLHAYFWCYEEMKQTPLEELRNLSRFLGTNPKEALLQAILDKCQIDKMREDKRKFDRLRAVDAHFGTGNVGDWKKTFTVEQYEVLEKIYREKMTGSRFYTRYKGSVDVL